jgi:hypothetical protein
MKQPTLIVVLVMLLFPTLLLAQCTWKWDCSSYPCKQVPICSSSIDLIPIKPPEVPPIPPPSIKPINIPTIPPIGTTKCEQRYICAEGQCSWQQVCK